MSAVKLRDFFENQWHTVLWADRKAQILSTIRSQTTQAPRQTISFSTTRNSWYFKTATTAALAFVLAYILYTPLSAPVIQQSGNLLVARQSGVVQAWYVGQLLATKWQINVVRQWVTTTTSQLQWWDIVYLYNTSKADFILRDGSRGTIEWPAQLTIVEHQDSWLVLTVDHARYMQIDKNNTTPSDNTVSEELVIETSTSRITTNKNDKVHLALVTTQERQFIQNKWDAVTIESIVPSTASPITQQLASSHVADVTDNVKVYAQVAMIYDELKTQSSSQTYDLTSDEFANNDLRTLLAITITKDEKPSHQGNRSKILTYQGAKWSQPTNSIAQEMESISNERSNTDIANQPETNINDGRTPMLFAMSAMSKSAADQQENVEPISTLPHQEAAIVGDILTNIETWSTSDWWDDISQNNTNIIQTPLSSNQIRLILALKSDNCITTSRLKSITTTFNFGSGSTLDDVISAITKNFYLTEELKSIINTLTICDDNYTEN